MYGLTFSLCPYSLQNIKNKCEENWEEGIAKDLWELILLQVHSIQFVPDIDWPSVNFFF